MDYLDFELKIGATAEGTYPLCVVRSPAGELDSHTQLPFDWTELTGRLQTVQSALQEEGQQRGILIDAEYGTAGPIAVGTVEELGRGLFEALLPESVRHLYRASLTLARDQGKGLRVRLRIQAPELASLPWEFAFDGSEGKYVGLSTRTPITRYLQVERPARALGVEPPLRILGMIASPRDRRQLDVGRERIQMESAIQHLIEAGHVTLEWLVGPTWRDLQEGLSESRGPWHVFHFIGHGGFDPQSGEGLLALCTDAGDTHRVSAAQLADLLGGHPSMRLAVLNSCEGARASSTDVFSSTGSVIMRRGIPAVVSMQFEITDAAALEFSRAFYDCLADQMPVDMAVTEARKAIHSRWEHRTVEWATPVLHMRSPDGVLFDIDVAARIFRGQAAAQDRRTPRYSRPTPRLTQVPSAATQEQAERALGVLHRKVKRFWVDGVLASSTRQSTLIHLGLEMMRTAVESPWIGVLDRPDQPSEPLSTQQSIGDVFDEQGGSLLILGEPGSGKTTTMLALTRDLIAKVEADPSRPVPVVFNLSSWGSTGPPLDDWLADELSAKYQIPRAVGRAWLAEDRLLPLLDGLDEVRPDRRAACVEAVNRFTETGALVGLIVCCRYKEYAELPTRLTLNAAVRLQRLTREQVFESIAAGGDRLAALERVLHRDSALLIEARSPLMLSIMVQAYCDLTLEQLDTEGIETAEQRRKHVLDTYVERMLRHRREGTPGG